MNELKAKSYEAFAAERKKYDGGRCIVGECDKPAYYEGGDARCWCPMCEDHAGIRESYLYYLMNVNLKIKTRMKWDKENTAALNRLLSESNQKLINELIEGGHL